METAATHGNLARGRPEPATSSSPRLRSERRTAAPGGTRLILLYDGDCRFCTRSAKVLARRFGVERIETRDFHEPGVLDAFPGVYYDACMKRMHVIHPDGRVFAGAEAVARVVATTRFIGWLAYLYYVPGVRQLAELGYFLVAKYRYKLFGRTEHCDGGTCHLHG